MTIRKKALAMTLATTIGTGLVTPVVIAGMPVIDISNLVQSVQQVAHMVEQIEILENQLNQAEQQFESMNGVRNMGNIIDSVYDNNMEDIDTAEILNTNGIQSAESYDLSEDTAELYQEQNQAAAYWQGHSQKFMEQAKNRFNELQKLVAKVNDAPDQKDILDLQARIQAENTLLQNELIKLDMMKSEAEAQQAMNEQKATQIRLNMRQGSTTHIE